MAASAWALFPMVPADWLPRFRGVPRYLSLVAPVVLFDVFSIFFRAHHALPPMNTKAGEPTAAMYGFSSLLLKVLREHAPSGFAFALDLPQPTFRHAAYAAYKAGRDRTPDALAAQRGRLRQLLDAFGVPALSAPGFEADDVLATLADRLHAAGSDVLVVSGDRDLLQVAREGVRILFLGARGQTPILYDAAAVEQRFGVKPWQLPSLMALVGDSADNLPGVPGVGTRTAAKWIRQFGNIDSLLQQLAPGVSAKFRDALALAADQLRLNERLARLRVDVPLESPRLADMPDAAAFRHVGDLFAELEFVSLLQRLRGVQASLLPGGDQPPGLR